MQLFGKSLFQPEFKNIGKAFEEKLANETTIRLFDIEDEIMKLNVSPSIIIEESAKVLDKTSDIECKLLDRSDDVPDRRDWTAEKKNLLIFDDLEWEKQNTCEKYEIGSRHSDVDCIYVAQNYYKLCLDKL